MHITYPHIHRYVYMNMNIYIYNSKFVIARPNDFNQLIWTSLHTEWYSYSQDVRTEFFLCCVVLLWIDTGRIYSYPPGLLHCHPGPPKDMSKCITWAHNSSYMSIGNTAWQNSVHFYGTFCIYICGSTYMHQFAISLTRSRRSFSIISPDLPKEVYMSCPVMWYQF